MKGRQLNFYLSTEDQMHLDQRFKQVGDLIAIEEVSASKRPHLRSSTVVEKMGAERLKILLMRNIDISNIVFENERHEDLFYIDTLRSPVIEYSRCYSDQLIIRRGRLYYNQDYYGTDGEKLTKNSAFLGWAETLFDLVKRNLTRRGNGDFLGPVAAQRQIEGTKLVSL